MNGDLIGRRNRRSRSCRRTLSGTPFLTSCVYRLRAAFAFTYRQFSTSRPRHHHPRRCLANHQLTRMQSICRKATLTDLGNNHENNTRNKPTIQGTEGQRSLSRRVLDVLGIMHVYPARPDVWRLRRGWWAAIRGCGLLGSYTTMEPIFDPQDPGDCGVKRSPACVRRDKKVQEGRADQYVEPPPPLLLSTHVYRSTWDT